jgi:hypothetical protein
VVQEHNRNRENEMSKRMIVTTEDNEGRKHSERIRHIPADEIPARREAVRQSMPRGSVYTVKVVDEN